MGRINKRKIQLKAACVTQDKFRNIRKEMRNCSSSNVELDDSLESEQAILNTFLVWRK